MMIVVVVVLVVVVVVGGGDGGGGGVVGEKMLGSIGDTYAWLTEGRWDIRSGCRHCSYG